MSCFKRQLKVHKEVSKIFSNDIILYEQDQINKQDQIIWPKGQYTWNFYFSLFQNKTSLVYYFNNLNYSKFYLQFKAILQDTQKEVVYLIEVPVGNILMQYQSIKIDYQKNFDELVKNDIQLNIQMSNAILLNNIPVTYTIIVQNSSAILIKQVTLYVKRYIVQINTMQKIQKKFKHIVYTQQIANSNVEKNNTLLFENQLLLNDLGVVIPTLETKNIQVFYKLKASVELEQHQLKKLYVSLPILVLTGVQEYQISQLEEMCNISNNDVETDGCGAFVVVQEIRHLE